MDYLSNLFYRVLGNFILASMFTLCHLTYKNSIIANGTRYLWLSVIVFAFFVYLQFKSTGHMLKFGLIKAFSSKHNSFLTRIYLKLVVASGILLFLYLIGLNIYVYSGGEAVRATMGSGENFFLFFDNSFWGILWGLIICAGFSMGLSAFLFSSLLLGPLANGITIALALHNWLNGLDFNLNAVFQAVLDMNVSDVVSLIINVIWLSLTFLISGSNNETPNVQT